MQPYPPDPATYMALMQQHQALMSGGMPPGAVPPSASGPPPAHLQQHMHHQVPFAAGAAGQSAVPSNTSAPGAPLMGSQSASVPSSAQPSGAQRVVPPAQAPLPAHMLPPAPHQPMSHHASYAFHSMPPHHMHSQMPSAPLGGAQPRGSGPSAPPSGQPAYDRKRQRGPNFGAPVYSMGNSKPRSQPMKTDDIGEPCRVIHMRNVTPDVSQLGLQDLIRSFGRINNIVMLRQKNQALVEMDSLQSAQQMVEYFKEHGYAEVDGRRIYLRYSVHQELTSGHTSKALLVSMFNVQYDVSAAAHITPMIVYQIFNGYGPVEKIVVLPKNESSARNHHRVQALVQFDSVENAERVKTLLQGQPVTLGETVTFTLDIQFSRMNEIKASSPQNSLVVPRVGAPPIPPPNTVLQSALTQQQTQQTQQQQAMSSSGSVQHQLQGQQPYGSPGGGGSSPSQPTDGDVPSPGTANPSATAYAATVAATEALSAATISPPHDVTPAGGMHSSEQPSPDGTSMLPPGSSPQDEPNVPGKSPPPTPDDYA